MTPYLRIRRKSKESKEIDPLREGNFPKSGDDRIDQVFYLCHRGFDWVSVDCRARDRVCPKLPSVVGDCAIFAFFFQIDSPDGTDSDTDRHTDTNRKVNLQRFRRL